MENQKMTFRVLGENGKETECEVLFSFDSEETGKSYIAYTDNTTDESGNTKVYASIYTPNEEPMNLLPIETDKEWKIIETILNTLQEQAKESLAEDEQ